jgi:hypothetical protein
MIAATIPHPCTSGYRLPANHAAAVRFLSREQVVRRLRVPAGDKLIGTRRETFGEFEASDERDSLSCGVSPLREVWVVRVRFTRPQWFVSAEYAHGIASSVIDAQTGQPLGLVVRGKFISGPITRP